MPSLSLPSIPETVRFSESKYTSRLARYSNRTIEKKIKSKKKSIENQKSKVVLEATQIRRTWGKSLFRSIFHLRYHAVEEQKLRMLEEVLRKRNQA